MVLTVDEINRIFSCLLGVDWLVAAMLYGTGLRISECLRAKDVNFGYRQISVRDGKGKKDRATMLPHSVEAPLRDHLNFALAAHEKELADGLPGASLHRTLARKYPAAPGD